MTGDYAYIRSIWLALVSALFVGALGLYGWRRRDVPGARPLAVSCLFIGLWLLGITGEAAAHDLSTKIGWRTFQGLVQLPAVTANTCFVLAYAYPGRWLSRRNVFLLFLPSLVAALLTLTNDSHHLIWRAYSFDGTLQTVRGSANWLLTGYAFSLILTSTLVLVRLFIRSPLHRWPVALMLLGQIGALAIYLLEIIFRDLDTPVDFVTVALLFRALLYGLALFGFRLLDPMVIARQLVIEQMPEGMVVFDAYGRVANLNPAAAGILSATETQARGRTLQELLPDCPDLTARLANADAAPVEISLGGGGESRSYALELAPLADFRGLILGRLLLMRDVTEQHRAQTRILEEQWAQATMQERVMLADELHDGLSQSLAFLNMQAQAAQVYLQVGRTQDAGATLGRLAEVALGLQSDMRELIGNLLVVSLPSEGFCETLRQVTARFEEQNGIPVRLEIGDDAAALCDPSYLAPTTGIQLVRIVQEALANVRKHAGFPGRVTVRLELTAGQMWLTVEDNGVGFDAAARADGEHYGLRVMGQRAVRIGGALAVHSAPGEGTRVEVCVPVQSPRVQSQ